MQYASGVNLPIFWAASIVWDLLTNCITSAIIIFLLILGQHDQWKSISELSIVFLILLMYNFAMMPVICLLSLLFSKPSLGMNVISISNFVISKSLASNFNRATLRNFKYDFCFTLQSGGIYDECGTRLHAENAWPCILGVSALYGDGLSIEITSAAYERDAVSHHL